MTLTDLKHVAEQLDQLIATLRILISVIATCLFTVAGALKMMATALDSKNAMDAVSST